MAFIDLVYSELKNLYQKHGRGFISADEFNGGISYVQAKIIRESFDFINNLANNMKIGRVNKRNYDKQKYYSEVVRSLLSNATLTYNSTTERFAFPDNHSFTQALYYDDKEVEEIPSDERIVLNNYATMPSLEYPISIYHSDDIEILPDTIISDVKLYYYRDALAPKWTYTIVSGDYLFNEDASDFQDLEIPSQFFDEVFSEIAKYFGIELRQPDMVQVFMSEEKKSEILKRD